MYRRAILVCAVSVFCLNVGAAHGGVKATNPDPPNGAIGVSSPLFQWTAGDTAFFHDVYFGTSEELTEADRVATRQPFTMYYRIEGLEAGVIYYWRVDEIEIDTVTTHTGDVWTFTAAPLTAYQPLPRDGDKWIATDTSLSWQPGMNASKHDVYLGTDADAVAARDASVFLVNQATASVTLEALAEDTTYYWAVDEIEQGGATHAGAVWSFTTIGPAAGLKAEYFNNMTATGEPIVTQTEDQIDYQWSDGEIAGGLSDNVSARWTADLEIAVTDAYTFITRTDDGARLYLDGRLIVDQWVDQGPTDAFSSPIELAGGSFHSLVMEYYENTGGAVAQLFWQTPALARTIIPGGALHAPRRARLVYPEPGSQNLPQSVTLVWNAGDEATGHDVYFGESAEAVADATTSSVGVYRGQQALTTYDPGPLEWNKTYYWRVDEIGAAGPVKGSVWSFTTANFIVVDDFESYTNEVGQRVFEVWVDGIGFTQPEPGHPGNGTGMAVGHDIWSPESSHYEGTIMETGIVHGGNQAMALYYDNTAASFLSETERTWATPQDWTINDVNGLTLFLRGNSKNAQDGLYVVLEDSAGNTGASVHPDPSRLAFPGWSRWRIPLSEFIDAGVNVTAVKKMILGIGNRDNPAPGGTGMVYVDDIRVAAPGGPMTAALFAEDFEGLTLGPNVDEGVAGEEVWTETPPPGWVIDESGIPGIGDPTTDGVTEWAGWAFANKDWWVQTADDQNRSQFSLGVGTVAVADPDEWDDQSHTDSASAGWYKTFMSTPAIDISAVEPGTLVLTFSSSWRPEYDSDYHQTGNLTVSFDGGDETELFLWESNTASPNYKTDATNETVTVPIDAPAGAESMVLTFGLFDAGNDWWWAIDNIEVTGLLTE